MNIDEYRSLDGVGIAALIRQGDITSGEVAKIANKLIDDENPEINAVIAKTPVESAAALERKSEGPLCGVPFLLKDVGLPFSGILNECGSRIMSGVVPEEDSALAKRIKRAGLVTLGRTNTPEFGINVTTEPKFYGATKNPWNTAHNPGGSSGGAAAAVAAGWVPLAHANDGGGSIRIPAHCCGLFGMKPSRGRISWSPQMDEAFFGMGSQLVVSRTVRDSAAAFDIMCGREPGDRFPEFAGAKSMQSALRDPVRPLRIGFWSEAPYGGPAIADEYISTLQGVADLLGRLGHKVSDVRPNVDQGISTDMFCNLNAGAFAGILRKASIGLGREINSDWLETCTQLWFEHGSRLSAIDLSDTLDRLNTLSRTFGALFDEYDVLLSPVGIGDAPLLGVMDQDAQWKSATDWADFLFSFYPFPAIFNATGQPACSVPAGLSRRGLPWGMHLAADLGNEATLFQLARQLEIENPWSLLAP